VERKFEPNDLVLLPILDAAGARVLGRKLVLEAKGEKLSRSEVVSLGRLKKSLAALRRARRARLDAQPAPIADRKEAFREEAAAWGAVHGWLESWSGTPKALGGEKVEETNRFIAALFGDGLKFLKLTFEASWLEADDRLQWLEDNDAEVVFTKLGGLEFLERVRAAHRKFGEALGVAEKSRTPSTEPSIREALDDFCAQLREYVVQVAAQASAGGVETKAKAARLLAPLAQWPSRHVIRSAESAAPQPPPAPTTPIT
jgi:hypothetical protein